MKYPRILRITVIAGGGLAEFCHDLAAQAAAMSLPWQIDPQRRELVTADWLREVRPAAVIGFFRTPAQVADLTSLGTPYINLSGYPPFPGFGWSVSTDHRAVGRLAAKWFLDRGFHHFLTQEPGSTPRGPESDKHSPGDRIDGFMETIAAAGYHCERVYKNHLRHTDDDPRGSHHLDRLASYLTDLRKPLGCFWFNDAVAIPWLLAARMAELNIPRDISMIGADNNAERCRSLHPSLSSVAMPWSDIARTCIDVLLRLLYRPNDPAPETVSHPPRRIVERQSTQAAITDKRLRRATRFIERRFSKPVTITEVARHCGISTARLNQLFKKELATTPHRWLQQQRMRKAQQLLETSDTTIADIATACGYASYRQFYNIFTATYGCSPGNWRTAHQSSEAS